MALQVVLQDQAPLADQVAAADLLAQSAGLPAQVQDHQAQFQDLQVHPGEAVEGKSTGEKPAFLRPVMPSLYINQK